MNLDDLIRAYRDRMDDHAVPPLHSDPQCTAFFNDAVRQASIRKRLILDRNNEECCLAPVAAGQVEVELHKRVLAIRSARWSASTTPLQLTTLKVMDRDCPEWPSTPNGVPTRLIVDAQSGSVVLWPAPALAGQLSFAVWRAPLDIEEMADGQDEPLIDEAWHADLLDWAEHLGCLTKDGEAGDPARSAAAEGRFTAKFGRLPSAHEIKCWAISPRRGQRAEFL